MVLRRPDNGYDHSAVQSTHITKSQQGNCKVEIIGTHGKTVADGHIFDRFSEDLIDLVHTQKIPRLQQLLPFLATRCHWETLQLLPSSNEQLEIELHSYLFILHSWRDDEDMIWVYEEEKRRTDEEMRRDWTALRSFHFTERWKWKC